MTSTKETFTVLLYVLFVTLLSIWACSLSDAIVYWSVSQDECKMVFVNGEPVDCCDFDFMNEKYEKVWVK